MVLPQGSGFLQYTVLAPIPNAKKLQSYKVAKWQSKK